MRPESAIEYLQGVFQASGRDIGTFSTRINALKAAVKARRFPPGGDVETVDWGEVWRPLEASSPWSRCSRL